MIARSRIAVAALALLAGCTTGQANTTPPITGPGGGPPNVALQLSVGTINYGNLAYGLNVLETFRGGNGFSAVPISEAVLHGPPSFRAPHGSQDPGSGKNTVPLGTATNQFVIGTGISAPTTPLAAADGWGIGPPSCSCGGINFYPFQPQFSDATLSTTLFSGGPEPYYGGPPAYPPTTLVASALSQLVSIPSGWAEGFYMVSLFHPPPAGRYSIDATYRQNGARVTKSASAQLPDSHLLPTMLGQPAVKSDHHGGLIVTVHFPHGVTQVLVNVIDANVPPSPPQSGGQPCATGLGFASLLFTKSGTKRIPDNLGNYGAGGAPTFCKNDILSVNLMGFDYDDVHLGPPYNAQQRPALPHRADMTYSTTVTFE